MEPMELSVYKFELLRRLSTSSPGILGERVCIAMFTFSKHHGVKHACSWCRIRVKGLNSGSEWFSNVTVHYNCFRCFSKALFSGHIPHQLNWRLLGKTNGISIFKKIFSKQFLCARKYERQQELVKFFFTLFVHYKGNAKRPKHTFTWSHFCIPFRSCTCLGKNFIQCKS